MISPESTKPCRAACGGYMEPFMDLGFQPMANGFHHHGSRDVPFYWLRPCRCSKCGLIQLWESLPPSTMFNFAYPFRTGGSARMVEHFKAFARDVSVYAHPPDVLHPLVVEIGCNDGTLLNEIRAVAPNAKYIGIEPATAAADEARAKGLMVYGMFFDDKAVREIVIGHQRKVDLVVASNVICHIPQPHETFKAVAEMLSPRGVFVFEEPDAIATFKNHEFEQFYDEHMTLLSTGPVFDMAQRAGLELFHVERQPTHGGSRRYYVGFKGWRPIDDTVETALIEDMKAIVGAADSWQRWGNQCRANVNRLGMLLDDFKCEGKRIAAYGATSKSTVLYNWMIKLGHDPLSLIDCVYDNTPQKIGLVTPTHGDDLSCHHSGIPIVHPDEFRANPPDYVLLTAWNHAEEIMDKEEWFRGGWITYVPEVVTKHNGRYHGERVEVTTQHN